MFEWLLAIIIVAAIFYAERLPDLFQLLEMKLKTSLDAAKEGSKMAKEKIKQVQDERNKKSAKPEKEETEENTPEEIEASLKFMGNYIKEDKKKKEKSADKPKAKIHSKDDKDKKDSPDDAEKPIDLEHRY